MTTAARKTTGTLATIALVVALATPAVANTRDLLMEHIHAKVAAEITRCFQPPKGVSPPYPTVTLLLNFKPDGILNGAPQLASDVSGNAKETAVALAVLRAASRCVRLDDFFNYKKQYMRWRSVRVLIDPSMGR